MINEGGMWIKKFPMWIIYILLIHNNNAYPLKVDNLPFLGEQCVRKGMMSTFLHNVTLSHKKYRNIFYISRIKNEKYILHTIVLILKRIDNFWFVRPSNWKVTKALHSLYERKKIFKDRILKAQTHFSWVIWS